MRHGTLTLALCMSTSLWTGCYQDIALSKDAVCDGQKQGDEDTVDSPFDRDGDGYFDGSNPDCQRTYSPAVLDCNDANADVNPASQEQTCNDIDDDCNPDTPDALDEDEDGSDSCEDCNDSEPLQSPMLPEQCDDDLDNDCDGDVNEDCGPDSYDDLWTLDRPIQYQCTFGLVNVGVTQLDVRDSNPNMTMTSIGTGDQPGIMSGTISGADVTVARTISGTCTEVYELNGTFTDASTLEGTFTASFIGGTNCFDCVDQRWPIKATRP